LVSILANVQSQLFACLTKEIRAFSREIRMGQPFQRRVAAGSSGEMTSPFGSKRKRIISIRSAKALRVAPNADWRGIAVILIFTISVLVTSFAHAGNATWNLNPGSGDWNTAGNWTPTAAPNGPADTATFGVSNTTGVSLSAITEVHSIVFNAGASAYTITASPNFPSLKLSGAGITNSSGITQNFVAVSAATGNPGVIFFTNSATAGTSTTFTNNGATVIGGAGGITEFGGTATAGGATITNNGATAPGQPAFDRSGGETQFFGSSTAGSATITNYGGTGGGGPGITSFDDTASAGGATITNSGGGLTEFFAHSTAANGIFINSNNSGTFDNSVTEFTEFATAANGTFTNNGSSAGGAGATEFFADSTAANGTFTNNGATASDGSGGATLFRDRSTAGAATLIANGGTGGGQGGAIVFEETSTGGTSRVELFGNGKLDISLHLDFPSVTVGSIEGSGHVFLGPNNLTVGSNNMSTTFSGVIHDGGAFNQAGGSLSKIGSGTLTLSGANTYTGGTTVSAGTLLVNNVSGSGTGTGAVQVNGGTLGGTGTIAGAVTIGTGSGPGALLSPGTSLGTLTIQSSLTLNSNATFQFELNSTTVMADKILANGVTISGAQFSFTDLGNSHLTAGTVFTVIDDTAISSILGTFSNLPNGSTFTANGNTFLVNYFGGDGNDLILTIEAVPEPSTLLALGLVEIVLLSRFLRRRRA
jgi:autotransporter-associated beta strand protein